MNNTSTVYPSIDRDKRQLLARGIVPPKQRDFASRAAFQQAVRDLLDDAVEREIAAEERAEANWIEHLKRVVIQPEAIRRCSIIGRALVRREQRQTLAVAA